MSRAVPRRVLVYAAALVVAVGALVVVRTRSDDADGLARYCDPPEQIADLPPLVAAADRVAVGVEAVGTVDDAVAAAEVRPDVLLVAERGGRLWELAGGRPAVSVLDLRDELVTTSIEQGLLGVAVSPDGKRAYVHATFADGTARVVEYPLVDGRPDPAGRRDVLVLDDPAPTHNGGRIAFGADGMLYVALGDGGDGALSGAAQDLGSPFGKILRIDPVPSGGDEYTIPADNPFVGVAGARGEIWALGFRNPWGWSIDRETGDLWVGDVGQLCFEEVNRAPDGGRGANFGWSHTEGAHEFVGPALGTGGVPDPSVDLPDLGPRPDGLTAPVLEYRHAEGACSVIGGFVYRGTAIPALEGTYLYADLCRRAVLTLRASGDGGWERGELAAEVPGGVVAFAEGADGEPYLVSVSSGVHRLVAGR